MDGTEKTPKKQETTKAEASSKTKKPAKAKEPKPKKEKAPKQPLVVFAFRLTADERDRIHKAAGPANASRFVKTAALAAAGGDRTAFEELVAISKATKK